MFREFQSANLSLPSNCSLARKLGKLCAQKSDSRKDQVLRKIKVFPSDGCKATGFLEKHPWQDILLSTFLWTRSKCHAVCHVCFSSYSFIRFFSRTKNPLNASPENAESYLKDCFVSPQKEGIGSARNIFNSPARLRFSGRSKFY